MTDKNQDLLKIVNYISKKAPKFNDETSFMLSEISDGEHYTTEITGISLLLTLLINCYQTHQWLTLEETHEECSMKILGEGGNVVIIGVVR